MAFTDYSDVVAGTAITWKSSGGDKALTLTSIANGAAREGDKSATLVDGTKGLPEYVEFRLESAVGTTVTSTELELYVGPSDSATAGTANPGNLTGADAGWSNPDELKGQLDFVGALSFSNARTTNVQITRFRYKPLLPYLIPALVNKTGQALSSTAGNHQLVMTPYYRRITG